MTATRRDALRLDNQLALGALIGGLIGILEVLVGMASPGSVLSRGHLLEAAVLYGAAGVVLALGGTLVLRLVRRRPISLTAGAAILVGAFCFLTVGGYVNLHLLPGASDPRSIWVTGFLLPVSAAVGLVFYLLLRLLGGAGAGSRLRFLARPRVAWPLCALLLGLLALISLIPARPAEKVRRTAPQGTGRNVILIVIDALRPDHMTTYGYSRPTTPGIDAWAGDALVFERAYAQAPWTKPATASLLTSLYPSMHGVNLMGSAVPQGIDLLPDLLSCHGYHTAIFTANYFVSPTFGFDRGVDRFYSSSPPRLAQLMLGHILYQLGSRVRPLMSLAEFLTRIERRLLGGGAPVTGLDAEGLTRALWGWLDEIGDTPFFAYMHYMEPHAPYSPPAPYDKMFASNIPDGGRVTNFPEYTGFLPFDVGSTVSPDSLADMLALYNGEIRFADQWMAALIEDLKRRGIYEKTLLLITADHGEEFYEHQGWGHGQSLFQELLHVPLIMSCPEALGAQGVRFPHIVRHIDLMPTILEVCALPLPESLAGWSLLPIVRGEEPDAPPRIVFSEVNHGGHFARSFQEGQRKVIRCRRGGDELLLAFDLGRDAGETENLLSAGELWPGQLRVRLEQFHEAAREQATPGEHVIIDQAMRERLKALGYLK